MLDKSPHAEDTCLVEVQKNGAHKGSLFVSLSYNNGCRAVEGSGPKRCGAMDLHHHRQVADDVIYQGRPRKGLG